MNFVKLIRPLSIGLLPLAASLLLGACSKPAPQEAPVRAVKVLTVGAQSMQASAEFAGEVRAQVESRLGFRVAGQLVQRRVNLGDTVKAGQVLAELDARDYQLATEAARAQQAAALSNRDLAAADFKRFKELKDQNFISGAEFERRSSVLKSAQAQLDQAQAQLSAQGNQASYTRLVADAAGVVTGVEAEPGQVLAAGTPVLRLARDGARDAVFSVPEDKVAALKVGGKAEVRVWGSGLVLPGTVREVAASADPITRTFVVKVALVGAAPALGSTVTVLPQAFDRGNVPVIKLPTTALRQEGGATQVWVLEPASMTVKTQAVQVLTADGNEVVVSGGLALGQQVVSSGVHALSPGQVVTLYKEKVPLALASQGQAAIDSVANTNAPVAK